MHFTQLPDSPLLTLFFHYCLPNKMISLETDFLWKVKAPLVPHEVCRLHPAEGSFGMLSVETCQHTLHLNFLEWMCTQEDEEGKWKTPAIFFLSLESVAYGRGGGKQID